jgi:hypothetical protein
MGLKNKDGTPFRLATVNPLVVNQHWLRDDNLVFHNFTWQFERISAESLKPPRRKLRDIVVMPKETKTIREKSVPIEAPTPIEVPTPIIKSPVIQTVETEQVKPENTIITLCLPLIGWNQKHDSLYGDSYKTPKYGEKSSFEAVILEQGDLAISLWTSATLERNGKIVNTVDYLKPGSIIFPSRYNDGQGKKIGDYRWWKVQSLDPRAEGVVIVAVITDIHPSFSG